MKDYVSAKERLTFKWKLNFTDVLFLVAITSILVVGGLYV